MIHTQGPFSVHKYSACGKHEGLICGGVVYDTDAVAIGAGDALLGRIEFASVTMGYPSPPRDEMLANVALFIAAPDLLTALGNLVAEADESRAIDWHDDMDLLDAARAALAKAIDTASVQAALDALRPATPSISQEGE